jgi:DNA-binding NtrC family response regulator
MTLIPVDGKVPMKHILIATRDQNACDIIGSCFRTGFKVDMGPNRDFCLDKFHNKTYEFIFIDLEMLLGSVPAHGFNDYRTALEPFWYAFPAAEIIVMASQEMIRDVVMAVKDGASNYLTYPISPDEVRLVTETIRESLRVQYELDYLRDKFWASDSLDVIQTKSSLMKDAFDKIRSVAPTKSTVLLTGETGTGKGLLAKIIHRHSNRGDAPFISVHCGAIPDTLLESELFGHEKGAFTGAVRKKLGKFEIAQGGTIFLDEIGTITSSAQIKLLQVIQDKTFQRVGGEEVIEVDVRIIAATNTDIKKMSDEGNFRKDLYYRLSVFPVEVPPLRERKEDIPSLVQVFLKRMSKFNSKEIHGVHQEVMEALGRYFWPGNIRELENLIERAYILESSSMLRHESFPSELFAPEAPQAQIILNSSLTLAEARRRSIATVERQYLREVLILHKGRIHKTAEMAGITERQLHKLMKKYGIRKEDFK